MELSRTAADDATAILAKAFAGAGGLQSAGFHEALARLAQRLERPAEDGGDRNVTRPADLPAGYTYLGQLIAHDMSFVSSEWPAIAALGEQAFDGFRDAQLQLDTIYGTGPDAFPMGYRDREDAGGRIGERTHLRTGSLRGPPAEACPFADPPDTDLPRIATPHLSDQVASTLADGQGELRAIVERMAADLAGGSTPASVLAYYMPSALRRLHPHDVLVADPRNDNNGILSQLTLQFHRLHNRIVDRLQDRIGLAGEALFETARAITVHVWRTIVWADYLKRILHPAVYAQYAPRPAEPDRKIEFLWRKPAGLMPVEFTHAAFRFGHAMIRDHYSFSRQVFGFDIGEVLMASSAGRLTGMPKNVTWLARWHLFFDGIEGPEPTQAARPVGATIRQRLQPDLSGLTEVARNALNKVPPEAGARPQLAYRDLLRHYTVPMATVEALLREARKHPALGSLLEARAVTASGSDRPAILADWLKRDRGALTDADIRIFAETPPLLVFVLAEAELAREGAGAGERPHAGLGVLGSILVAETVLGTLTEFGAGTRAGYARLLAEPEHTRDVFGHGPPASMADFLSWLGPPPTIR